MEGYDFFITMGTAALLSQISDPKKRLAIRSICLKIFKSIKAAYAGDAEFV